MEEIAAAQQRHNAMVGHAAARPVDAWVREGVWGGMERNQKQDLLGLQDGPRSAEDCVAAANLMDSDIRVDGRATWPSSLVGNAGWAARTGLEPLIGSSVGLGSGEGGEAHAQCFTRRRSRPVSRVPAPKPKPHLSLPAPYDHTTGSWASQTFALASGRSIRRAYSIEALDGAGKKADLLQRLHICPAQLEQELPCCTPRYADTDSYRPSEVSCGPLSFPIVRRAGTRLPAPQSVPATAMPEERGAVELVVAAVAGCRQQRPAPTRDAKPARGRLP
ncbi:hypothetical protein PSPO01_09361 [Paraphaeosphaeria sporulosa]